MYCDHKMVKPSNFYTVIGVIDGIILGVIKEFLAEETIGIFNMTYYTERWDEDWYDELVRFFTEKRSRDDQILLAQYVRMCYKISKITGGPIDIGVMRAITSICRETCEDPMAKLMNMVNACARDVHNPENIMAELARRFNA